MIPKNFYVALFIGLASTLFAPDMKSQRPVRSRYSVEVGRRHAYCSYLSPLVCHGADFALNGSWRKTMPFDSDWEMEFDGGLDFSDAKNPARNASMLFCEASFSWGMERMVTLPADFRLGVGGRLSSVAGVLYLRRNSNNPANAIFRIGLDASLSLSRRCRIGRLSITPFDQFSLPSLGAFFSPEYGETYYEIYLGNRRGLAHFGWWGNNFGLDNLFGVELNFRKHSLLLGWRCDLQTYHANNIDTQLWTHSAVVGISF